MRLLVFAAFLMGSTAHAYTLEQVLSAPFPEGLTSSPKGDAIAWVMNANGVRNLWVARAPRYEAAAITKFTRDDGQDLSDLHFLPDNSAVVFTRGGSANGRGEIPNPTNDPAGAKQEIWIAPVAGNEHKLGDGRASVIAPDGSAIAWISGSQIWGIATAAGAKPEQWIHARGSARELAFSPDSKQLAFTSSRGDHSFIGVYDRTAKSLHFLSPGFDRDQSPAWSPDGKQLAFLRERARKEGAAWGPVRTGQPWSIRIADVATGDSKEIWRAREGMGSEFWAMVAKNQLLWGADNRIVFPWEGDGWLHLYSVAANGGEAKLLTPGEFEVEYADLTPDNASVVFSSNQDDLDRKHLWRVAVTGGTAQRLTPGNGIEWSPAPLAGNAIALLRSDWKMPARPALLENGAVRDLAANAIPREFPANDLIEPQAVTVSAADGLRIHAQLFLPKGAGKHPAVIFFHGGSRRQMLLGWNPRSYYHRAYGFNEYLASKGYIVLSVNYRSGIGYGEAFREFPAYGATGGVEFNDVLGAGLYLRSRDDVDAAHIGLWGGSYGGYLTALGLARASDLFAAGVDLHGVHDWNLEIDNPVPVTEPDRRLEVAKVAWESSPMAYMKTWRSPVLLIQGDDDRNVVFAQNVQLAEALRKQGVPYEELVFPDEVHEFLMHSHWLTALHAADGFLEKYLKTR